MSIGSMGVGSAAEGAPEMGFWPVAVYTVIYADFSGTLDIVIIALLAFGGAVTYLMIRKAKQIFKAAKSRSNIRKKHSRRGRASDNSDLLRSLFDITVEMLPDHDAVFWAVSLSFLGNVLVGFGLLLKLGSDIVTMTSPPAAMVGLFLLPILYLMVVSTAAIW